MNHDGGGDGCGLIAMVLFCAFMIVMDGCSDCGRMQDDLRDLEERVLLLEQSKRVGQGDAR